jgi:hypothetical protein
VNEAFIKLCKIGLAKNGFSWRGIHQLNINIFNHTDFLPSQMTEISKPADVETAHSEGGVNDIRTPSTSNGQQTAKS